MEHLLIKEIKLATKIAPRLAKQLILYAATNEFLILAPKPISLFEQTAIWKGEIRSRRNQDQIILEIPQKIYEFYNLDEHDYTIMTSDESPEILQIHI